MWRNDPAKSRVKLAPHWKGPFKVLSAHPSAQGESVTYTIVDVHDLKSKPQCVHYNRLKPFISPIDHDRGLLAAPQRHAGLLPPYSALSGSLPFSTHVTPCPPNPRAPSSFSSVPVPVSPPPPSAPMLASPPPSAPVILRPTPSYKSPIPCSGQRTRSGRVVTRPDRLGFCT